MPTACNYPAVPNASNSLSAVQGESLLSVLVISRSLTAKCWVGTDLRMANWEGSIVKTLGEST